MGLPGWSDLALTAGRSSRVHLPSHLQRLWFLV
jgi:hypothetical protein